MAYIETTDDARLPYFYNLSKTVGRGGFNWEEDTMVVQFFLQRMYLTGKLGPAPKGNMTVDGICGNITKNWILKFQLDSQRAGANIFVDGTVSSAENRSLDASITRTRYTIIYLNAGVKKNEPFLYNNLESHQAVPPKLRAYIGAMKASNQQLFNPFASVAAA
jgi:hypothetical protein